MKQRNDTGPHLLDGTQLRIARLTRGLSQEELAERAGMRVQNISRLENGRVVDPQLSTVVALARVLGVTVDSLLRARAEGGAS